MFRLLTQLHESGVVSFADKLPWRLPIDDGIVMTNAGGYLSSYEYVGPNPQMIAPREFLDLVNDGNTALVKSGGWTLDFDVCKRKGGSFTPGSPMAPPSAQLFDLERQALVERAGVHFQTRQHLSVVYHAPKAIADKAESWVFAEPRDSNVSQEDANASQTLDEFVTGREQIEQILGNRLKLRRLGLRASLDVDGTPTVYDDLLRYLYFTYRGRWQPMLAAPAGITVAKLFAAHEVAMDWRPRIGTDSVAVVMTTRAPEASMLGYLRRLDELQMEYRANLRLTVLGKRESLKYVEQKESEWTGAATGLFSSMTAKLTKSAPKLNHMALLNQSSAAELKLRIEKGELVVVFPTFTVTLYGPDWNSVKKQATDVQKALEDCGHVSEVARVNSGRWFLAGLPGEVWAVQGRDAWTSANAAQTMALTSTWTGMDEIPSDFYERGSQPHIVATTTGGAVGKYPLHWNTAGHTLLLGAQRTGKTVAMKRIVLAHLNQKRPGAFILDRDRGMGTIAKQLQDEGWADYLDLEDPSVSLCPGEFIHEGEAEQQYFVGVIEAAMKRAKIERTAATRAALVDGVARMAQTELRRMSDVKSFVSNQDVWTAIDRATDGRTVHGRLLNGAPSGRAMRPVQIVETAILGGMDPEDTTLVYRQLLHLMDRMSRRRLHMLAMFDECSVYLYDEFLATYFFEVLRRWGKRDVAGVFATQGAIDLKEAGRFGKALAQECKTKIFCGDSSAADEQAMADLCWVSSQLTPTKCKAIARNAASRSYLYLSPLGEATFNLALQKVEKALTTCDEGDAQAEVRALQQAHPDDWFERHLKARGVSDAWIERYRELRARAKPPALTGDKTPSTSTGVAA